MTIMKMPGRFTRLVLAVACVGSACAQSFGVSNFAGANSVRDNASATQNFFRKPLGVASDANGNLYVADGDDNRIRRINPGGIITTIAGTGRGGFFGDGGQAVDAQLNFPRNLALDRKRNLLYVVDYFNARVRQINLQTGIIRTVAGNGILRFTAPGPDAGAIPMSPNGIAVDADGNLYISDETANRIYKVAVPPGALTILAGTGEFGDAGDNAPAIGAKFRFPTGMAMDASNNLIVIDYLNTRVRKINLQTGMITALAGDGFPTTDGDGGSATLASVLYPDAVSADDAGNVLISEYLQIRIVRNGIISTVAGTKVRGYTGDGGSALQSRIGFSEGVTALGGSDFAISDTENHRLRRVTQGVISTIAGTDVKDGGPATSAYLNSPRGIIRDTAGNVFITDSQNFLLRKINATGQINTAAGIGIPGSPLERLGLSRGMALDSRGNLYIADSGNNRILLIPQNGPSRIFAGPANGSSGPSTEGGLATTAKFSSPRGVAVDAADNVYVADWGNNRIRKIDAALGTVTSIAGNGRSAFAGDGAAASAAGLSPAAIVIDKSGNLIVADDVNNRIRQIDLKTGIITTIAGNGTAGASTDNTAAKLVSLTFPEAVAVDAQNNLYVGQLGYIHKISVTTGLINRIAGNGSFATTKETGAAVEVPMDPLDIKVNADGSILVADATNHRVRLLTALRPASLTISSGNNQSVPPGTNLSIAVKITDATGLIIFNEPVTFAVVSGVATLSKLTSFTSTDGIASTVVVVGSDAGPVTVRASAAGLTPVTFTLTSTLGAVLPIVSSGGVAGAPLSTPAIRAVSPNAIASVFGTNFAPAGTSKIVSASDLVNGRIPLNLAGVCVQVGAVKAPIYALFANQVNFQVPALVAASTNVDVRVITSCGTSDEKISLPESVPVRAATPEFFYFSQTVSGRNPIAAINAISGQPVGATFAAAKPGDVVSLFATGLGETDPALEAGQIPDSIARVRGNVQIQLGGKPLANSNILYVGIAPFNPGLYQVNLIIPADASDGDLAVDLQVGTQSTPVGPYLTVKGGGPAPSESFKQRQLDQLQRSEGLTKREAPQVRRH